MDCQPSIMAPPNPYSNLSRSALSRASRRHRRYERAAPQPVLQYRIGTTRALARRGSEDRALTAPLDVISAVGFRGGAGTAEAMQRDHCERGQHGNYIDLSRAFCATPSR